MPYFASTGEVIFHGAEVNSTFAFRIHEDGTGKRMISNHVREIYGVSPDGNFVIVWTTEQHGSAIQGLPSPAVRPCQFVMACATYGGSPMGRVFMYL